MSDVSKQRIVNVMGTIRPTFRKVAKSLTDIDLVLVEEAFERLLLVRNRMARPLLCTDGAGRAGLRPCVQLDGHSVLFVAAHRRDLQGKQRVCRPGADSHPPSA